MRIRIIVDDFFFAVNKGNSIETLAYMTVSKIGSSLFHAIYFLPYVKRALLYERWHMIESNGK